ncbi:RagB/SusD family nutrient uptake outer membrane protein [Solitalea koreensis]|nr:RagB/SusD family nutrient uptake outer membrane protein [Solitalea koreensis]
MNQSNKQNKASALFTSGWIVLSFIMLITFSGCEKFLELPVKDKVPQDQLFNDEQGFMDALNGVYFGMDNPNNGVKNLYTNDLSMGMLSIMTNNYYNAATSALGSGMYAATAKYDYAGAALRPEIDGIWSGMYNNIANVNNILVHIDTKRDVFSSDKYQRVKGEALALRALFHFDLARLFGKSPVTGLNEKAIPYVTKFSGVSTPRVSLNAALDSCISDLSKAESILAQTDTTSVSDVSLDLFNGFTQNHMNYWAAKALLARVYLYKGDFPKAMEYAKSVIASAKFPLVTSNVALAANPTRDRLFSQEHLFSIYSTNVTTINNGLFLGPAPFAVAKATKDAIFTGNTGSALDYRYLSWFEPTGNANIFAPSKFYQDKGLPYKLQNIVPLLKVSEMYYIVAECANNAGDLATGLSFLNKVRTSRGLSPLTSATITDATMLSGEITKEYKKEFFQEGQTFFYYKRLNKDLAVETGITTVPSNAYVFPIPDKENEYNN